MRLSWLDYFFELVQVNERRSSCIRRKVGAVAFDPNTKRVLSMGYNGAPAGVQECIKRGTCYRQENDIPSGMREELCFAVHAEQNLICYAARFGVPLKGAWVCVSCKPCLSCLKALKSVGIERVIFKEDYPVENYLYSILAEGIDLLSYTEAKGEVSLW